MGFLKLQNTNKHQLKVFSLNWWFRVELLEKGCLHISVKIVCRCRQHGILCSYKVPQSSTQVSVVCVLPRQNFDFRDNSNTLVNLPLKNTIKDEYSVCVVVQQGGVRLGLRGAKSGRGVFQLDAGHRPGKQQLFLHYRYLCLSRVCVGCSHGVSLYCGLNIQYCQG